MYTKIFFNLTQKTNIIIIPKISHENLTSSSDQVSLLHSILPGKENNDKSTQATNTVLSSIYANCWSSAQAYNIMYAAPGGLEQPGGGIMQ